MLETEAKTKWCPFAIVRSLQFSAGNRSYNGSRLSKEDPLCIGSECMAWVSPSGRCGMVPPTNYNT